MKDLSNDALHVLFTFMLIGAILCMAFGIR